MDSFSSHSLIVASQSDITSEQYWTAVNIWHNNPHFVSRRLRGSLILFSGVVSHSQGIDYYELMNRVCTVHESTSLDDNILQKLNYNGINIKENSNDLQHSSVGVLLTIKKLIPRNGGKYQSCLELAILDHGGDFALFAPLDSQASHVPGLLAVSTPYPYSVQLVGQQMQLCMEENAVVMEMIDKRAKKYAPIFRTWSGPDAIVHLTRAEHAELIIGGMKHLEKARWYKFLHPWLGQGLITSSGAQWHSQRKLITPTFHFKILETFCDIFVENSEILVEKLAAEAVAEGEKGFDVYPFINRCTLDIICETAMGTQIHAQDKKQSEYVEAVFDISYLTILRAVRPWIHSDFIFNKIEMGKKYNHCLEVLHGFTEKVIRDRKEENLKSQDTDHKLSENKNEEFVMGYKKRKAFLDLLLEASQDGTRLSDQELRQEVDTFMFAGHDTTTTSIAFVLFMIASYPDVQKKVIEEQDTIFQGSSRPITMRDLNEMKYLERVIKETLRLYPSVPFIMRTLEADTQCGEYFLPAGCLINIHIYHIHRDPEYFPDPEEFDPDHFLPERVQGRHPYAYIPFSAGPRNCIGQKFAMLEEKTIIASVLRRFLLRAIDDRKNMLLIQELILKPNAGIKLALTPRNVVQ